MGQPLLGKEGRAGSSVQGGGQGEGHRYTHRGSEGPAATSGKSWLNPGEEAEGKSLIGPRGRLGRKGVLWGHGEEEQLNREWFWDQGRDSRKRGVSDREEWMAGRGARLWR